MKFAISNRVIGIIFIIIFLSLLFYVQTTEWGARTARDNIKLSFIPSLALTFCLLVSIGMILSPSSHEVPEKLINYSSVYLITIFVTIIAIFIYFYLMQQLGFIVSSIIFLGLGNYILGLKDKKIALIIALAFTLVIFSVFTILGVQVPSGVFI